MSQENIMQFSIFLRAAMDTRGLKQSQLAELSDVSQGAISRYLNSRASPKAEEVIRLANALGVSIDWLLTGREPGAANAFLGTMRAAKDIALSEGRTLEEAEEVFDSLTIPKRIPLRRIPVVGWAHAGQAASYDELPKDWQELIPTDCRDSRAFGVTLEGDSMEPSFREGDMLVLMPSEEIYSGCFAVCRFVDDGVVFRRLEFIGDRIQLVPLNARYEPSHHQRSEFNWIYPVWGRWSQLWK